MSIQGNYRSALQSNGEMMLMTILIELGLNDDSYYDILCSVKSTVQCNNVCANPRQKCVRTCACVSAIDVLTNGLNDLTCSRCRTLFIRCLVSNTYLINDNLSLTFLINKSLIEVGFGWRFESNVFVVTFSL